MRGLLRRTRFGGVCAAAALSSVVMAAVPARAEDGGLLGFLSSAFGGGGNQAPAAAPPPAPSEGEQVRPLTVRRTPRKAASGTARAHFARGPTKTGPVSIYEDPTLRNGDAVMTKDGMKVFAGGRFSAEHPYGDTDFIAVSASKDVGPNLKKTVIELNKLPHS